MPRVTYETVRYSTQRKASSVKLNSAGKVLALALTMFGCVEREECPKELAVSITYAGQPSGTFYARKVVDGEFAGGTMGEVIPGGGISTRGFTLDGCFPDRAKGGYVEGWVDLDHDDYQRCPCTGTGSVCWSVYDLTCQPEPGDPHGKTEFKLRGSLTEVALTIVD